MLTATEAARLLRKPVATLTDWRYHGGGPPYVRVGRGIRGVRYRRRDVLIWKDTQQPPRCLPPRVRVIRS